VAAQARQYQNVGLEEFNDDAADLVTLLTSEGDRLRRRVWQGVWHEDYDARRG
jgi:hypothetical protein